MSKGYLLFFILLLSYLLTMIVRQISIKRNIIDIPNNRSSHSIPTPRGGGLAIVISWYAGLLWLFVCGKIESNLFMALLSGSILAIVSFVDDILDIKPVIRLVCQTASVVSALYFLGGVENLSINSVVIIPSGIFTLLAAIGFVWFINLYNFLDGIDGYASIEAICISGALYLLTGDFLTIILIACITGFLIWNWPKAKIFMGDVGSTQLGFVLFVFGIHNHNQEKLSILWWIIITSPFWFDATYTLFRRWKNKEKLSQAHRKHIYQRLVQSGFSHLKVDLLLILLNSILVCIVLYFRNNNLMQLLVLLFSIGIMYLVARYTDSKFPFLPDSPLQK